LPPTDRVVVDWRISEYELVDDNEASHVDKPVVLFSDVITIIIIIIITPSSSHTISASLISTVSQLPTGKTAIQQYNTQKTLN